MSSGYALVLMYCVPGASTMRPEFHVIWRPPTYPQCDGSVASRCACEHIRGSLAGEEPANAAILSGGGQERGPGVTDEPIGALLRRLRVEAGRSQDDQAAVLSDLSGRAVTRNEVSRWEHERRLLTPYWQEHVALSFGIPSAELRRAVGAARIRRRRGSVPPPTSVAPSALDESGRPDVPAAITLEEASQLTAHAHRCYQATRYQELATTLPPLSASVAELVEDSKGDRRRDAVLLLTSIEAVTAKLATKIGHGAAAWRAATRAQDAAHTADDAYARAAATYQLVCAALITGRTDMAEQLAVSAAAEIRGTTPSDLTWRGALTLIAAIIAARRHDGAAARDRLDYAERLADQLGTDGNIGWTAFGPTNVQIHRMSAAVELDEPRNALAVADGLETVEIPDGLRGRQAQVRLDSAWANAQLNEDPFALINLLDAERVAPQLVHSSHTARALITDLMRRERRHAMPGLRGLAERAGVVA